MIFTQKCQLENINKYRHVFCSCKYNFYQMHGCQKGILLMINNFFQKIHEPETGA